MLLEFSVENFLSFKEKTTFSMLPHESYKELLDGNVTHTGGSRVPRVLNSAVIFGPNASGKTNFVKALDFVRFFLDAPLDYRVNEIQLKFGFLKDYKEKPTTFSVLFLTGNIIFDYTFSLLNGIIIHEKLESLENEPKRQMKLLYERSDEFEDGIKFGNFLKGSRLDIFKKTRPEGLFLRSLYEWNNETTEKAYLWFKSGIYTFINSTETERRGIVDTLQEFVVNNESTKSIEALIRMADLGIDRIKVKPKEIEFPLEGKKGQENTFIISEDLHVIRRNGLSAQHWDAEFIHKAKDEDDKDVFIGLDIMHESMGTKKLFALSGPIIDFLKDGVTVCFDELTSSMHPFLVKAIIDLFHDPKINTNGAQLIFNTHDVFFLNKKFFRRDQIWFASKNKYGATELTGLHDFDVRNDEALGAKYLMGAYGAIPIINYKDLYTFEGGENGEDG